jgi:hypothetical protein
MQIRIVDVPPGEAPEEIRRAWVGLILPLVPGETGPRPIISHGVLSGPRWLIARLWRLLTGQYHRYMQYAVPVDAALEELEWTAPDAAAWWRENTPHLIGRGRAFGFAAEVCEEIGGPSPFSDYEQ